MVGAVEGAGGVTGADQGVATGCAHQEFGHIFADHGGGDGGDLAGADQLDADLAHQCGAGFRVAGWQDGRGEDEFAGRAVGGAHAFGDGAHAVHELVADNDVEGADGAAQFGPCGDDIADGAGMEAAHGDHGGGGGVDVAGDDRLPGQHDLAGDHDGVDGFVGHGAVAADAVDDQIDAVGAGHQGAWLDDECVEGQAAPEVDAEGGLWGGGGQDAICDHGLGAAQSFFGGLEDQFDAAGELVAVLAEQLGHSHADSCVAVVAAGVHDAGGL